MNKKYTNTLEKCIEKTRKNINQISCFYEFYGTKEGKYFDAERNKLRPLSHIFCWTQSFFTGMAVISYQVTKDEQFVKWLYSAYDEYHDKVFKTPFETMHDLGFLYSPYAVAMYKLLGDPKMKKIGMKAADELIKRYVPNGNYIKAWGRMDNEIPAYVDNELAKDHFFTKSDGLAIIDCMMNVPLLFWASEVSKHPVYRDIALEHIATTIKYFVRNDYSVFHAYRFDPKTGNPIGGENFCGYDVNSHWARGTTWIMYGLAIAYSYTKNPEYLDLSIKITKKFIENCENDGIPVWDFKLPKEKPAIYSGKGEGLDWDVTNANNKKYVLDTSAASIAICAIDEILKHTENEELQLYANKTLDSLIEYHFDASSETDGLLKNSNGNMTCTNFGDYYFMEALANKLYEFERVW